MKYSKSEMKKLNENIISGLNSLQTEIRAWTISSSLDKNSGGVFIIGTIVDASKACEINTQIDKVQWIIKDWEEVAHCHCGRLAPVSVLNGLGNCLNCDHLQSDRMDI